MKMHIKRPRPKMGRPRVGHHQNYSHSHSHSHQNSSGADALERVDSRCRHNTQYLRQFVEKYTNYAREALSSGDRVAAEGFLQQADHYQRLLNERVQDRQLAEKAQREAVEEVQHESGNLDSNSATSIADSADASDGAKESAADIVAPVASAPGV